MRPGIPQIRHSLLRHPIRTIEARTAKDPAMRRIGQAAKYLAPLLTSGTFITIFLSTPGVGSLTGLLVWGLMGGLPGGLASWGIGQAFKNAKAERESLPLKKATALMLREKRVSRDELRNRGVNLEEIGEKIIIDKHFEFEQILGMGGMAMTLKVKDHKLGGNRAFKIALPNLLTNADALARFKREAQGLNRIDSPRVVRIRDLKEMNRETFIEILSAAIAYARRSNRHTDDLEINIEALPEKVPYIDMAFIEGETLQTYLDAAPTGLPIEDALNIAIEIAEGLHDCAAFDIVHRDLKPENIFLVQNHRSQLKHSVKIIDFGLVKMTGNQPSSSSVNLTQVGMAMGTPMFTSPEQLRGEASIDWRTDQYTLGTLLFHMLTGQYPFKGWKDLVEGPPAQFNYHLTQYNTKVITLKANDVRTAYANPDWQAAVAPVAEVINTMLETSADARYQTWEENIQALRLALRRVVGEGPTESVVIDQ